MFTSKWCSHCATQKDKFNTAKLYPVYVDIDEEIYDSYKDIAEVNELPTIVILEGMKPIRTFVGDTEIEEIKKEL